MNIINVELVEYSENHFDDLLKIINNPTVAEMTHFNYPQTKEMLEKKIPIMTTQTSNRYFRLVKFENQITGFVAAYSMEKKLVLIYFM